MGRKSVALAELFVADLFWGFGFVASIWAMQSMGPFALTTIRFALAFSVTALLTLVQPKLRSEWRLDTLMLSAIPGLLLGGTLIFQTWGLRYTTATRSGFLTGLYVVFVPLVERFWLRKPLHPMHFVFVVMALVGTALIVDVQGGRWNWGDVLTFICCLTATAQICWLGRMSGKVRSPLVFNSFQGLWASVIPLGLALVFESAPGWPATNEAWIGLLSLSFGSTWLAFALQIRAQRELSTATASLLFLLESPLALLFGATLLHEKVTGLQAVGAGLILLASVLAIRLERLASVRRQSIVQS